MTAASDVVERRPDTATAMLAEAFLDQYPDECAAELEGRPAAEILAALSALSPSGVARLIERLTGAAACAVVGGLPEDQVTTVLTQVDPGRLAAIVARLDAPDRDATLAHLPPAGRREVVELMAYPDETAGQLMDTRVPTFRLDMPVTRVRPRLRELRSMGVRDVVVVDGEGHLAGTIWLADIALSDEDARIGDIVRWEPVSIPAMAPREEVVERLAAFNLTSLPVVDAAGRVVGIIAHDRLLDAAEREVSADVQTMVGVSKDEQALSPVAFAVRKRLPWLQINLATAFLAASVVGVFESTIARYTALAVLLPVVAGQSGNTGAQALAVTMRGLVLREIRLRHWPRMAAKEATVGLVNGFGVALTTSLGVFVWSRSVGLAAIIGSSMVLSMVVAGLAGALVPMVLVACNQDPAQSSSIILTTVTDIVGFFSFLGIATLLSGLI